MSIFSSKTHRRFNVLNIFVLVVVFMITAMFPGSALKSANAAGGGLTVEITVDGIPDETEASVTFLKIIEDIPYEITKQTKDHVVTFTTTFGGDCTVTGGSIPGYNPPDSITIPLVKIKGQFVIRRTLTYVADTIKVDSIVVSPSALKILKGFSEILTADVFPVNASVQTVIWTSIDENVATVAGGVVSGINMGSTTVTATITDGPSYSDSCDISVFEITDFLAITTIPASPGDIIQLPATVDALTTSDGTNSYEWYDIPVLLWSCTDGTIAGNTVTFNSIGTFQLNGSIIGTDILAKITVNVTGTSIIQPTAVTLSPSAITEIHPTDLYPTVLTIASVTPADADLSDIYWFSTEPTIATVVKTGLLTADVKAVSNGYAAVQVYRNDGQFLGSCPVTVTTDETLTDPLYIQATDINGVALDQFPDKDSIYITCYNLDTHPGPYAIRVSEKSSDPILGENLIDENNDFVIGPDDSTVRFKLAEYVDFEPSTSFSKSNFVSMSLSNDFPTGDYEDGTAQTLTDNFKVTSPVPTGYIDVDIRQLDQFDNVSTILHPSIIGTDVILGREIKDQTVLETTYEDYLNPAWYEGAPPEIPKYTDEAKLIGYVKDTDNDGDYEVDWLDPKEPLKIGGYVLLIEIPGVSGGYFETNLNIDDPFNEEELVKEVHISRESIVYKMIIMNFEQTP
ncbi:Ig-like domain-containing protein [Youngiibacter multivorans]|uniref:Uncharacterized protein YjdB n=1 Tax=Youngiibacter multivorans TaxID=937251 RepID=A0ABS4G1K3_9CLOT|nr:Ig-like domain-containing protein [Youngiibacter multivorans]MBP1918377.1 uncharacterized protein YjdB [Youngiibacter multivorans]